MRELIKHIYELRYRRAWTLFCLGLHRFRPQSRVLLSAKLAASSGYYTNLEERFAGGSKITDIVIRAPLGEQCFHWRQTQLGKQPPGTSRDGGARSASLQSRAGGVPFIKAKFGHQTRVAMRTHYETHSLTYWKNICGLPWLRFATLICSGSCFNVDDANLIQTHTGSRDEDRELNLNGDAGQADTTSQLVWRQYTI